MPPTPELSSGIPPVLAPARGHLRLTGALAHTINNALTGTIGYLELALRQSPPDGPLARDLQAALAGSHRAARAVRQFVAFASSPAEVPTGLVSLRDIAATAASEARALSPEGITVVSTGERPARVAGHAVLLAAAVDEVVYNALEAMGTAGRLTLETEEAGGRSRLWVRDSGPGLPAHVQDQLFEPFLTTKPFGHLGLGLALASELVRAQGGILSVFSCPGLGTTVVFNFPAFKDPEPRPLPAPKSPLSRGAKTVPGKSGRTEMAGRSFAESGQDGRVS
jgi:signal transduction histidine kinase